MTNRLQKQPVLTYIPAVPAVRGRKAFCMETQVIKGWKPYSPPKGGGAAAGGGGSSRPSSSSQTISLDSLASNTGISLPPGAVPVYAPGISTGGSSNQLIGYTVPPSPSSSSSSSPSLGGGAGSGMVPIYERRTECYPEILPVPGSPARIDQGANTGWNGGARSIDEVPVGGYFEVTLPSSPAGVMIGLSDGAFDHTYNHPSHALVARPSGITPVEYGADVGPEVPLGSRVRVIRGQSSVRMYVDGELVHTSSNPVHGSAYVDATLYAATDYVSDPVIGRFYELDASADVMLGGAIDPIPGGIAELAVETIAVAVLDGLARAGGLAGMRVETESDPAYRHSLPVDAVMSVGAEVAGHGVLYPGGGTVSGFDYASGALGIVGKASDVATFGGRGAFCRPVLSAQAGRPEVSIEQSTGVFPFPQGSGHIVSGESVSAAGRMAVAGKSSEGDYFGGSAPAATTYTLIAWEEYLPSWLMDGGEMLFSLDRMRMDTIVLFFLHEGMEISDQLDAYLIVSMEALDGLAVTDEVTFHSVVKMALQERMAVTDSTSVARREAIQYAVNAISGAVSRYENFGFRQFASAGGHTYAIDGSGLYRLEGQSDDGAGLNAVIDFGASDYGTAQAKRVGSVYAGIATDGCVYLRVTGDDGLERIYRAVGGENESRVLTAKGLAARHWRIRLELMDASYADLDNLEIEVGVSQRRLRR